MQFFSRTNVCVAVALGLGVLIWAARVRLAAPLPSIDNKPIAETMSLARSGKFLDDVTVAWVRRHKCASCHTGYPYLLARPTLGDIQAPALLEVRRFLDQRVAAWDEGGVGAGMLKGDPGITDQSEGITEVVAVAATLAMYDAHSTGMLRPITRQALDRMFSLQLADGHWNWNNTGLAPLECDQYYGAVYAALGVGHAPDDYALGETARVGVARLKGYLQKNRPPNVHHQIWLLWASCKLDELLTPDERQVIIDRLWSLQRDDGGWCLPSLGHWDFRDDRQKEPDASSDGYATGLVLYVLRQCGTPIADKSIQRGVRWLKTHQRTSGAWFTHSLNWHKSRHLIGNAGTAWAVMALKECGE